jgi:uncharacterized protein (DUF488 family)
VTAVATLYTLGYEKRSLEEFVELLAAARIDVLMDVRDVAWSHKKGFAKKALAEAMEGAGIRYVHAQFAGNPKRLRTDTTELPALLDAYGGHLDADLSILERFIELIGAFQDEEKRVCLVCFERDPAACHRSVLAERWARETGGRVEHLGTDRPVRPSRAPSSA